LLFVPATWETRMIPELIDTLVAVRDALLGHLPINSIEILRQIPHPIPGYRKQDGTWVNAATWPVSDDQKVLAPGLMDPWYDPVKSASFDTAIKALGPDFPTLKTAVVSLKSTFAPVIGEIDSNVDAPGASTAKVAGLYALFQLLYEMTKLAKDKSLTTISALQREANALWAAKGFSNNATKNRLPKLDILFAFHPFADASVRIFRTVDSPIVDYFDMFDPIAAKPKLFFTKRILEILWPKPGGSPSGGAEGFSAGEQAGLLFRYLGYAYVASVMLQSGLFRWDGVDSGQGIWVSCDYNRGTWSGSENPLPRVSDISIQNITAKSVADFFVLLTQRRLVNEKASSEMIKILDVGCCFSIFDPDRLDDVLASKCGFVDDIANDAMVLEDPVASKYVVVTVTKNPSLATNLATKQFQFFTSIRTAIASI
jgi:hypothetical protein